MKARQMDYRLVRIAAASLRRSGCIGCGHIRAGNSLDECFCRLRLCHIGTFHSCFQRGDQYICAFEGRPVRIAVTASIGGAIIPPLVGMAGDCFGLRTPMLISALCLVYVFTVSAFGRAKYE